MSDIHSLISNLKVSEIFDSIQGEGPSTGTPSIFLRLSTCNLKCSWCDTKYTWDWENYDINKEIKEMDVQEVVRRINRSSKLSNIVITGGEPLLQQDKLVLLLTLLKTTNRENEFDHRPYRIEIETNGTIRPQNELVKLIDQWNISPKTSNSLNEIQGINLEKYYSKSLPYFRNLENAYFKFIVDKPEDIKEIDELIKKYELPNKRVILMPQATTKEDLLKKSMWLEEFAKENDYTMSTRLHVLLWENQRAK